MRTQEAKWRENLRIVWAITAKDLLEAVKNKNTIAVLITSIMMVFFYRWMPTIFESNDPVYVLVHDAGNSKLVAYLENSQNLKVYTYSSEAKLKQVLANGDKPELGLVIPAGFDQAIANGSDLTLQGYVMYWVSQKDSEALKQFVGSEIAGLVGRPVSIRTEGNIVYHQPDSDGIGVQAGFSFIFVLVMVGLSLISHLFLEEKQSRTIDSLLVSPANPGHVVTAKAITGMFYCLIGGGIVLAINHNLILHWWLAIANLVALSLFTSSLGLLLGGRIENRGQLTLWSWVILVPLLIPMFLILLAELVPATLIQILRLIPTVTAFNLLRTSFANPIPIGTSLIQLAWILVCAVAILAVTAWLVRYQELANQGPSLWEKARQLWLQKMELATQGSNSLFKPLSGGFSQSKDLSPLAPSPSKRTGDKNLGISSREDVQRESHPGLDGLRIILAIAGKDIREAVKNKIFISLILGVCVMIASNAVIPLLLAQKEIPTAYVYDEGHSTILRGLLGGEDFHIGLVDSRQELEAAISEAQATRVGLILPADFDQKAGSGQVVQLEGFAAHWAKQDQVRQWTAFFEEQLGLAAWTPIKIEISEHPLYPGTEAGGNPLLVIVLLVTVIMTMGAALVPLLLVEEKENHTLEALLASPATFTHLISGKALAGSTFCLLAALVVILFNRNLFVNGWVVLLAVLLGAAFAVAAGLFIGTLSDTPSSTSIWGGLTLVILIALTMLQFLDQESLAPLFRSILYWFPGSHLVNLLRLSMVETIPLQQFLSRLSILAVEVAAIYVLIGLLVRRRYR